MKKHHVHQQMEKDPPDNIEQGSISKFLTRQTKQTRLIILISVIGLLIFTLIAVTFSFKDKLFQTLYPKPASLAVDPIDDLTRQLLEGNQQFKLLEESSGVVPQESTPSAAPTASPTLTPTPTPTPTSTPTPATSPATESTPSAVQGESTNPKLQEKQKLLVDMVDIAKKRKELLLEKMRSNPQEFLNKATLVNQRDQLPKEVQPYIEQKVQDEGELIVIHSDDFQNKKSTYDYFLGEKTDKSKPLGKYKYRLQFINPPNTISGLQVQVEGVALDRNMVVISTKTISASVLAAITPVSGDQKTLVILISAPGDTTPSSTFTVDYINSFIFGSGSPESRTLNGYYKDNSFNKISFSGNTVGPFSLDYNHPAWVFCDTHSWADNADTRAANSGVNLANYQRKIYIFKTHPVLCPQSGSGTIAGNPSMAWIFDRNINVFLHEMGHNLGNHHASFLNCGSNVINSPANCQRAEYGDNTDVMGISTMTAPQFNGPHKIAMGWIPNVQTVTNTGTYTIAPLEATTSLPQILRINKPDTSEYYYVSYRQKTGYDFGFPDILVRGVNIHVWNENPNIQTKLLDINPGFTLDTTDAALSDGVTFYDRLNTISIKQINHILSTETNVGSATVEVSFSAPTPPPTTPRRVFVSSQTFNGILGGLDGADAKCQTMANASTRYPDLKNSTWKVWLSDRTTSAASRLSHTGRFTLVNGTQVANDWNSLNSTLLSPINIDENGNTVSNDAVWTQTKPDGTAVVQFGSACKDWTSSEGYPIDLGGFARTGGTNHSNSYWTDSGQGSDCNYLKRIYCFEEPAPSPTPTPPPSVTYSLNPGWSAIGIPFSGFTAETLMTSPQYVNNKCDRLLGADKVWDKNLPSVFITLHDLRVNQGYWIRCNEPVLFTLTGTSSPSLQIAQGWNLITMPLKAVQPLQSSTFMSDQTLANNNCQTIRELGLSEPYFTTTPELLNVGQGYYLYCNSAFTITFANSFITNASALSFNTSPISLLSRPEIPAIPTPTPTPTPTPKPSPKPDLAVSRIKVLGTAKVKSKNRINVTIQNKGNNTVKTRGAVALKITQPDKTGLGSCNGSFSSPAINKTTTVQIRNCPAFKTSGNHTITATADSTNTILESNENNNTLETTVNVR